MKGEAGSWLSAAEVLARWGKSRAQAIEGYRRFVLDGLADGPRDDLYRVVDQRYLGDDEFVERVEQRAGDAEERPIVEISWAEITEQVCKHFGLSVWAVLHRGRAREIVQVRRIMTWLGRELAGMTNQAMAKQLHQEPAALSRGLGKLAEEMASNGELGGIVEKLCDSLRKGRRPKRSIRFA